MKILITGPDGLLGSNLTRELLAQNFAVKAIHIVKIIALTLFLKSIKASPIAIIINAEREAAIKMVKSPR